MTRIWWNVCVVILLLGDLKVCAVSDCPVQNGAVPTVEAGLLIGTVQFEYGAGWKFDAGKVMTYSVSESIHFTEGLTLILLASAASDFGEQLVVRLQDRRETWFELFTQYGQFGVRGSKLTRTMFPNAYMYPRPNRDRVDAYTLRAIGSKLFLSAINADGFHMPQDAEITAPLHKFAFEEFFTISFGSDSFVGVFGKIFMSSSYDGDFDVQAMIHDMYNYTQPHDEARNAWYTFDGHLDNLDDMDGYAAQSDANYDYVPGRLESLQAVRVGNTPLQITHPSDLDYEGEWTISTWLRPTVPVWFPVTDPRPIHVHYERLNAGKLNLASLHAKEIFHVSILSETCTQLNEVNTDRFGIDSGQQILVVLVKAPSCHDCLPDKIDAQVGGILLAGNCSFDGLHLDIPMARISLDQDANSFETLYGRNESFLDVLESKLRKTYQDQETDLPHKTRWYASSPVGFYMSTEDSAGFGTIGTCDACNGRRVYNQTRESAPRTIAYFARIDMHVSATNNHLKFAIGVQTFKVPYLVNEWVNLAVTYDAHDTVTVYVNGESVQTIHGVQIKEHTSQSRTDINLSHADIDDMRIYKRVLQDEEIRRLPVRCPPGEQGFGGSDCVPCTRGTYKAVAGSERCTACSANKNTLEEGAQSIDRCVCKAGYSLESSTCVVVPPGFYRSDAMSSYESCPVHSSSKAGAKSIKDCLCDPGYESSSNGQTCTACPVGKFNGASGRNCIECKRLDDSTNDCITDDTQGSLVCHGLCEGAIGFQVNTAGDGLEQCPIGTYNDGQNVNCTRCALGHTTTKRGAVSTYDCTCDVGYTFYGLPLSSQTCIPCSAHTFKNAKGVQACTDCDDTETSDIGQTRCQCVTARYRNGTTGTCEACPVDTYKDVVGDHLCTPCAENATTNGTDTQEACFCMPGYYGTDEGLCFPCGIRSYKRNVGNYSCLQCTDPHHTTLQIGSTSIQECVCMPGYEPGPVPHRCQACNVSFYKNYSGNNACTRCPGESVNMQTGATACACAPGQYKNANDKCVQCDIDFYKSDLGDGNCTKCPVNAGTQAPGSVVCHCKPGFENVNAGPCTACAEDYYKVGYGNYTCQICPDRESTFGVTGSESCSCMTGSVRNSNLSQSCVCDRGYEVQLYKKYCDFDVSGNCQAFKSITGFIVRMGNFNYDTMKFNTLETVIDLFALGRQNIPSSDAISELLYDWLKDLMQWSTGHVYDAPHHDLEAVTSACAKACLKNDFTFGTDFMDSYHRDSFKRKIFGYDGFTEVIGDIKCRYFTIANIRYLHEMYTKYNFVSQFQGMKDYFKIRDDDLYICEPKIMPENVVGTYQYAQKVFGNSLYVVNDTNLQEYPCVQCAPGFEKPSISNEERCTTCGFAEHVDPVTQACTCKPGRERNVDVNNTCGCSPGFGNQSAAAPGGNCTVCPKDFFRAGVADGPCLPCPDHSNTSGTTGNEECTCKEGYAMYGSHSSDSATTSPDVCVLCEVGKYTVDGNTACAPCPASSTSPLGSTSLLQCICIAGHTGPDGAACTACEAGKYKAESGSAACTDCSAGKYSSTVALATEAGCHACLANSNSASGSTSPEECFCSANFYFMDTSYSVYDNKKCIATAGVAVWTNLEDAKQVCSARDDCEFFNKHVSSVVICSFDATTSYSEGYTGYQKIPASCQSCPTGTFSNAGAQSAGECLCNAGYGLNTQSSECIQCEVGKYKVDTGNTECAPCPASSTSPLGSTLLIQCTCSAGHTGPDGGLCTACEAGKYKSTTGSDHCIDCPAGSHSSDSAATSLDDCLLCAVGKYTENNLPCEDCPEFSTTLEPGTSISDCICDAGYSGPSADTCQACWKGKYKPGAGSAPCTNCGAGKYSESIGATSESLCLECDAGKYVDVVGSTNAVFCTNCPLDSTSPEGSPSETACKCNAGFTGPDGGPCTACDAGKYKTSDGSHSCSQCPSLQTSPAQSTGIADCQCNMGYTGPDGGQCSPCEEGEYKDTIGSGLCTSCPTETFSNAAAQSADECLCNPGYYALGGYLETTARTRGQCLYDTTNKFGTTSCDTTNLEKAKTECDNLEGCKGFQCVELSSTNHFYVECTSFSSPSNNYAEADLWEKIPRSCEACPENTYKAGIGDELELCTACPSDSSSPSQSDAIQDCVCNIGYTGPDGGTCAACPENTYKESVGNAPCNSCPASTITDGEGSDSASDCVARPVCTVTNYVTGDRSNGVSYGPNDQIPNFEERCPPNNYDGYSVLVDADGNFQLYCVSLKECTIWSPCMWILFSGGFTTIYDPTKIPDGQTCD